MVSECSSIFSLNGAPGPVCIRTITWFSSSWMGTHLWKQGSFQSFLWSVCHCFFSAYIGRNKMAKIHVRVSLVYWAFNKLVQQVSHMRNIIITIKLSFYSIISYYYCYSYANDDGDFIKVSNEVWRRRKKAPVVREHFRYLKLFTNIQMDWLKSTNKLERWYSPQGCYLNEVGVFGP